MIWTIILPADKAKETDLILEVNSMKKKKLWIALLVAFVVLAASVVYLNRAVIFQRGNPIPYLTGAWLISE